MKQYNPERSIMGTVESLAASALVIESIESVIQKNEKYAFRLYSRSGLMHIALHVAGHDPIIGRGETMQEAFADFKSRIKGINE